MRDSLGGDTQLADAPRFRAYWEHLEDRSVLTMARSEWNRLSLRFGEPVTLDVQRTPIAAVDKQASVVGAFGQLHSSATAQITIMRYDEKDAPTPINVDKYTVWTDMSGHRSLNQMISGASTQHNTNFSKFLEENVFIIKQDPGPDHWLPVPAAPVLAIVRKSV